MFVPLKSNSDAKPRISNFAYDENIRMCLSEIFDEIYHRRSNVETVFSSLKRKLGEETKMENPTARLCEGYIKFINYNILVSITYHYVTEGNITPEFLDKSVIEELKQKKGYRASRNDKERIKKMLDRVGDKKHGNAKKKDYGEE